MPERRKLITVRLSPAALAEVDRLAAEDDRTRSDMLRVLLKQGLAAVQARQSKARPR